MATFREQGSLENPAIEARFDAICRFLQKNTSKSLIQGNQSLRFTDTGCVAIFPQKVIGERCQIELAGLILPNSGKSLFQIYQQILNITGNPNDSMFNSPTITTAFRDHALKNEPVIVAVTGYNINPKNPATVIAFTEGFSTTRALNYLKSKIQEVFACQQ